jgi:hypothetical protein
VTGFKVISYFVLSAVVVFTALVCVQAWRRREPVLDVIEFDGSALWRKARWMVVVLLALAFLALLIINNLS